jgi:hypothetical protein
MWTTLPLALALTLSPGEAGDLRITNDRVTYGMFGTPRPDAAKILPGDWYIVAFDIDGISVDKSGRIRYSMAMEVTDEKGKVHYRQDPQELETYNSLGGSRLPSVATVKIGLDQPPGDYTLKVTVSDRANKASKVLTRKFTVAKPDFGLVQLNTSIDPEGRIPAPTIGVVGQVVWVNFVAVGFERGGNKKQPNVQVQMRILDENNRETVAQPFAGEVNQDVPENVRGLPMQFLLNFNRPGKFTVKLRGTDAVTKKNVEVSFPVTVLEPK